MTTIDKYDKSIYIQYAKRTQLVEQINQQYHLDEASSIPGQLQMVSTSQRLSEIDLLLGVPTVSPWAFFSPPPKYKNQRRSPFGFFRVAPSMGSFEEEEENEKHLDTIECHTEEEKKEKETIKSCFSQIKSINQLLSFIVGRMGQFLQG